MTNFNHRLEPYNQNDPSKGDLLDFVGSSSGRAEAMIVMLQTDFIHGMNELNNNTVFSALEAIRLECADIKQTVEHFCNT